VGAATAFGLVGLLYGGFWVFVLLEGRASK
jgi:hypothetical protein